MNTLKRLNIVILLISFIFLFGVNVEAKTLSDLKKELSSAEAKYSANQQQKEQTEAEIKSIKDKIVSLSAEKEKVQKDIVDLNNELEELAKDIDKMQKEIKSIVNYYQLTNSTSMYLEYVFNATSFTDFIYRLAVSEQLSEYRKVTIDKYNKLIDENKKKVKELAEKEVALDKLQDELSIQLSKLGSNLSKITEEAVDIKEEIKDLKKQVDTYQNTYKCSLNEQLSTCINRYNSSSGNAYLPSAAGFYRPIVTGALNYEYGYTPKYGAFHDGIDFSIPHGTPVYSVADGIVVSVKPHQSCGGNMVYIGHKVNGKSYTSAYFHLADPILVREGQVVTYNTKIGTSGGVHAIEWWDSPQCSTGAHLHFQIATGIYKTDYFWYSNFRSRSFNPRTVINFPATDVRFNGR